MYFYQWNTGDYNETRIDTYNLGGGEQLIQATLIVSISDCQNSRIVSCNFASNDGSGYIMSDIKCPLMDSTAASSTAATFFATITSHRDYYFDRQ